MSMNFSLEHLIVEVNGHRVRGWAKQNDAFSPPELTLTETERSPEGQMVASSTGEKGGECGFKLLVNSPSTKWFGRQLAEIQRGVIKSFSLTARHPPSGYSARAERGVLKGGPTGPKLGSGVPAAREFMIDFEVFIGNWDAVNTQEPPSLA